MDSHTDMVIDPQCSDYFCSWKKSYPVSPPTLDNFKENMDSYILVAYIYIFILLIFCGILLSLVKNKCTLRYIDTKTQTNLLVFTTVNIIYVIISLILHLIYKQENICYYEPYCFENNNTLYSEKYWYKLINKECPNNIIEIFDIFYDIYGNYGNPNTITSNCKKSEYGCCHYNAQCSFAMSVKKENNINPLVLYNHYVANGRGYTNSPVWKKDHSGSNCLSIEDIIIKLINYYDKSNYVSLIIYIAIYFTWCIIIYIISLYTNMKKTHTELVDLEEGEKDNLTKSSNKGKNYTVISGNSIIKCGSDKSNSILKASC